jgi:hypothetical protein
MTDAEWKFLTRCHAEGEAWFVPAQTRMVKRLLRTGLLSVIPKVTRYNPMRGSTERRATPKGALPQLEVGEGSYTPAPEAIVDFKASARKLEVE